jgi:hypothetical protein
MTAIAELVVPKSMPRIFAMIECSFVNSSQKSEGIFVIGGEPQVRDDSLENREQLSVVSE